jgi:hypothetical protein
MLKTVPIKTRRIKLIMLRLVNDTLKLNIPNIMIPTKNDIRYI